MPESFRALCSDHYINQKLAVKMPLPSTRETVLELFERVRRVYPSMNSFRRVREEHSLESPQSEMPHRWVAIKNTCIRSGTVNPSQSPDGYALHRLLLEVAPTFLSITPLDVDFVELLYGFDLNAVGNHDAIVLDALLSESPLASLVHIPGATPTDYQPVFGFTFGKNREIEANFEVKTRPGPGQAPPAGDAEPESPISVYLSLRKFGGVSDIRDLPRTLDTLSKIGEELVQERLIPSLLVPIRQAIASAQ